MTSVGYGDIGPQKPGCNLKSLVVEKSGLSLSLGLHIGQAETTCWSFSFKKAVRAGRTESCRADSLRNIMERMVCIGIVLIAGLCWAYILGEARVSKMTPKP